MGLLRFSSGFLSIIRFSQYVLECDFNFHYDMVLTCSCSSERWANYIFRLAFYPSLGSLSMYKNVILFSMFRLSGVDETAFNLCHFRSLFVGMFLMS